MAKIILDKHEEALLMLFNGLENLASETRRALIDKNNTQTKEYVEWSNFLQGVTQAKLNYINALKDDAKREY